MYSVYSKNVYVIFCTNESETKYLDIPEAEICIHPSPISVQIMADHGWWPSHAYFGHIPRPEPMGFEPETLWVTGYEGVNP